MLQFSNSQRAHHGAALQEEVSLFLLRRLPARPACPMAARQRQQLRLPPEVNRALYVRNLPFKITAEEMYDIFGKFGAIRQIRLGNAADTRGTAFVVYEDIFDAKTAVDHLSGFNVCGRYLVVLYYQQTKMQKRQDTEREMKELAEMRAKLGIDQGDANHDLTKR